MAIVPYTGTDDRGLVGMHRSSEEHNIITRCADAVATTPIGAGQPVQRVAGQDMLCAAFGAGDFLGVTTSHIEMDQTTGYYEGQNVPIMTMGTLWVAAGTAIVAGVPAGYNPANDRWSAVAANYVAVPGVEFDSNAAVGRLVKLRINRPAA